MAQVTNKGAAAHVAQARRAGDTPPARPADTGPADGGDPPDLSDLQREQLIEDARMRMVTADTLESRLLWCGRMTAMIRGRSDLQIARMERARGLAR